MDELLRQSPIQLPSKASATEIRNHWVVVKTYDGEGAGPWLVDLSHKCRWDLQDGRLDERTPTGMAVPAAAGQCRLENGILVSRMNRVQAAIWHLGDAETPELPTDPGYTDVSEATAFLALLGPMVFTIVEKLTDLDCADRNWPLPYLLQGPFSRVACKLVVLSRDSDRGGALVFTCARGYGRDMARAVLTAGEEVGLRPAGEKRFTSFISSLRI